MLCQMRCQITEAVPLGIYTTEKLTSNTPAGDVGTSGDRSIVGGISTTIIDLHILMDPITFLLLFNITVWCYWTFK